MAGYLDGVKEFPVSIAPSFVGQYDVANKTVVITDKRGTHWKGYGVDLSAADLRRVADEFRKLADSLDTLGVMEEVLEKD